MSLWHSAFFTNWHQKSLVLLMKHLKNILLGQKTCRLMFLNVMHPKTDTIYSAAVQ